jgi:hypothetical protein
MTREQLIEANRRLRAGESISSVGDKILGNYQNFRNALLEAGYRVETSRRLVPIQAERLDDEGDD